MAKPYNLRIAGISGADPLDVPLWDLQTDFRAGYFQATAAKVGNAEADLSVNLLTYDMVTDLTAGFGFKHFNQGQRSYYIPEPIGTGTTWTSNTVNPLLWTGRSSEPLMCGPDLVETPINAAFLQFQEFLGNIYGIDTKNHIVWRINAGVWEHYVGSGTGWTANQISGTVTNTANAAGLIRITAGTAHGLATGDVVVISGVVGTVEANGTWTVTVVDATHFDLQGSTFAVAYVSGGTWFADAAGLQDEPTELFTWGLILLVGVKKGSKARKTTDGQTYSDFLDATPAASEAQHFTVVGTDATGYLLWYSKGDVIYERKAGGISKNVGQSIDVRSMVWWQDKIYGTTQYDFWKYDADLNIVETIASSTLRSRYDGRFCVIHQNELWFPLGGILYAYDGTSVFNRVTWSFEGTRDKPFYTGDVIGAHPSGKNLYVILKVVTSDSSPNYFHYIMRWTGKTGGWHPIAVIAANHAPSPNFNDASALYQYNDNLYYSCGNDFPVGSNYAFTGYFKTNGDVPMRVDPTGEYRVGAINLGLYDFERPGLEKYLKEWRFSIQAQQSGGGFVKLYYKALGATTWTLVGTSADGTQDDTTMQFGSAGAWVTGQYFWLKVELGNSDAQNVSAWWLDSLYLLALPTYKQVYQGVVTVTLPKDTEEQTGDQGGSMISYNMSSIITALKNGINQAAPVILTHPLDGSTYTVKLKPVTDGDRLMSKDKSDTRSMERAFQFGFVEMK